ncbi:MAG: hypothetical protein JXR64_02805 [Spirochaetales bacterium]|nr:hypothetical protein [Spirochaetales bacterium]
MRVESKDYLTIKATNKKGDICILKHISIISWGNYIRGKIKIDDLNITNKEKEFLKNG